MVGGYYADRYFGTGYLFLFVGLVLGGVAGVRRLLQIAVPPGPDAGRGSSSSTDGGEPSTVRRGDSHADRGEDGSGDD
jgi:F0F1-type ATP synthase assembly protein I